MKNLHAYQPLTNVALATFGLQIASARREVGWTAQDLAERLGVSRQLVSRIEKGNPSVSVGVMFDAAVLCGVPLFDRPPAGVRDVAAVEAARFALLPQRVRVTTEVDDDF